MASGSNDGYSDPHFWLKVFQHISELKEDDYSLQDIQDYVEFEDSYPSNTLQPDLEYDFGDGIECQNETETGKI